jgi:hypothetical protein
MEDSRRLAAPAGRRFITANPMGVWYSIANSESMMFVFAIMWEGILIPCGAQVSPEGKVEELLPLSAHARQLFGQLPQGIMRLYIRRVEAAAAGKDWL